MQQSGRVKTAYTAEYADPIIVSAGEALGVDDRVETWDGNPQWVWVWCSDPRGRQGWVPSGWIAWEGERATAARDYAATELTVAAGEAVTATEAESGWLWCTDQLGRSGWVPAANVELDSAP
jgi:hypothetical protein